MEHKEPIYTVTLEYAFRTNEGKEHKTLSFRRGKARDLLHAERVSEDSQSTTLHLMSTLSIEKLKPDDFENMDLADFQSVMTFFRKATEHSASFAEKEKLAKTGGNAG